MKNYEKYKDSDNPTDAWLKFLYSFCGSYKCCEGCPFDDVCRMDEDDWYKAKCFARWLFADESINEDASKHYTSDKTNRNVW